VRTHFTAVRPLIMKFHRTLLTAVYLCLQYECTLYAHMDNSLLYRARAKRPRFRFLLADGDEQFSSVVITTKRADIQTLRFVYFKKSF